MEFNEYSFFVDIEKLHLTLCKSVAKDPIRPCLNHILLDTKNRCMVSSDGHVLKEIPVKIEAECELPNHIYIYIDSQAIKNLVGKNRVDVIEYEGSYITVITHLSSGTQYKNDFNYRYPFYRTVYPKLFLDGYIKFDKKELKNIISFCKQAKKECDYISVVLFVEKGSNLVSLSYKDIDGIEKEISVKLETPANITVKLGLSPKYLCKMSKDWTGGMWLSEPSKPVVLDYKYNSLGLMMQLELYDSIFPDDHKCDINPLNRIEALQAVKTAPTYEAADKSQPGAAQVKPKRAKRKQTIKAAQRIEPEPIEAAQVDASQPIEPEPIEAAQVDASQPIEPEPIEAAQVDAARPIEPEPIEAAQVDAERPIEPEPIEAAQVDASRPIEPEPIEAAQVDAAQPIESAPAYEVREKSQPGIFALPWQIRLLLSILRSFGLIKSPLRYAVAQQLEAYMVALLPTATPTETLLQAICPALGAQFGSPCHTLCGFGRIDAFANSLENLWKMGTFGRRIDPHAAFIECGGVVEAGSRGGAAMTGCRGGVAVAGGRGGAAVHGGRGGAVASMQRGVASAGMRSGASLLPSYALWQLSPITRPTGAGPPGQPAALPVSLLA